RRVDELITACDREGIRYAGFGFYFNTARARAPEVLPLSSDQRRRHAQCDVCDRPCDLAPKECAAKVHLLIGRRNLYSRLATRQPLRKQLGICLRQYVPHSKRAIQFIQRWRPERAIPRHHQRYVLIQLMKKRDTRT